MLTESSSSDPGHVTFFLEEICTLLRSVFRVLPLFGNTRTPFMGFIFYRHENAIAGGVGILPSQSVDDGDASVAEEARAHFTS